MRVELRLYANLRDRLPESRRGRTTLDLPDGATLQDLLDRLEIPARLASMVLVDGVQVSRKPGDRKALRLREGQSVAVFPPLAGG